MLPGRPPKPDGQKVHRNRPTYPPAELPATPAGAVPKPNADLTPAAKRLWTRTWKLPQAAMWTEADVPAMARLVAMQSDPRQWNDYKKLAEMRQLEDRFGMNPYARRQLGWKLPGEDASKPPVPAEVAGDRRSLKVV